MIASYIAIGAGLGMLLTGYVALVFFKASRDDVELCILTAIACFLVAIALSV